MNLDEIDTSLIDQVAAEQLGVAPQQAAPQQAPENKATPQEQATQDVAPTMERKDPFEFFEVGDGDNKQVYTPDQLRGMASRYPKMNYEYQTQVAPIKGTIGFINQLREQAAASGAELNDDDIAALLQDALSSYAGQKNPTNTSSPNIPPAGRSDQPIQTGVSQTSNMALDQQIEMWERENAVTMPPGLKEAVANSGSLQQQVAELTALVRQLTETNHQTTTQAQEHLSRAQQERSAAGQQQLVNNLQRIQNEFGFADEDEQDFMAFVQGRGYSIYELLDYNLAKTVAQDYKNNKDAPELERFRSIAQRRQSYTGNLSPSASGSQTSGTPPVDPDTQFIGEMTDTIYKNRNMG